MKIEIDELGRLHLERAGKMALQFCPRVSGRARITYPSGDQEGIWEACGSWCPLFGDVYEGVEGMVGRLEICECRTLVGQITDKREAK